MMILSTCVAKCLGPSEGRRTLVCWDVSVCCLGRVRGLSADRAKPVGFEHSQNSLLRVSTDSCEWCTLFTWACVLEYSSAVRCDRAQHQPVEHPDTCTGLNL